MGIVYMQKNTRNDIDKFAKANIVGIYIYVYIVCQWYIGDLPMIYQCVLMWEFNKNIMGRYYKYSGHTMGIYWEYQPSFDRKIDTLDSIRLDLIQI